MKNRIPATGQEGRVQFTIESQSGSVIIGKLEMADGATEQGTPYSVDAVLSNSTARLLGFPESEIADSTPNGAFQKLAAKSQYDWNLIQEYTTAGTYTYAIPSGYNQIGIFMIGGGGAGGKLCDTSYYQSGDYYDEITGGCAGVVNCAVLNASDISSLSIVVGRGGNASAGGSTSVTTNTSQAFTALGGSQGIAIHNTRDYYNLDMSNMVGGQLPFVNTVNFQKGNRVAAGATNQYISMSSLNSAFLGYLGGAQNTPSQSVNPFEKDINSARKFLLSAGGCIRANNYRGSLSNTNTTNADAPNLILPDIKGGNGKAITNSTAYAPIAHGNDATGYGNGGGGMFVWTTYSGAAPDATNVTGGYGSDGAVFIYAR